MFIIRMGLPEMESLWLDLSQRSTLNKLKKDETAFFKKWVKSMEHLRHDPRYPGLKTHEIKPLSKRYGFKVWQSYLENTKKPGRMYWMYGPGPNEITILGIEPHPEDAKRGAYDRIRLDQLPPLIQGLHPWLVWGRGFAALTATSTGKSRDILCKCVSPREKCVTVHFNLESFFSPFYGGRF